MMNYHWLRIAVFGGFWIFTASSASADGIRFYSPGTFVQTGSVIYINGGSAYHADRHYEHEPAYREQHRYPSYNSGYRRGDKSHAYPRYQHNYRAQKHIPSTHIYGAYPYNNHSYHQSRVNPHASSYQKKHSYGGGSYGYNHYSPRGNASYYQY